MNMAQPHVHMPVTVRFSGRICLGEGVQMMHVVTLVMFMFQRVMLVLVFVFVPFGQMQPNAINNVALVTCSFIGSPFNMNATAVPMNGA